MIGSLLAWVASHSQIITLHSTEVITKVNSGCSAEWYPTVWEKEEKVTFKKKSVIYQTSTNIFSLFSLIFIKRILIDITWVFITNDAGGVTALLSNAMANVRYHCIRFYNVECSVSRPDRASHLEI